MIAAAPVDAPSESYQSYIEQIPPEDGPQMFGMHESVGCDSSLNGNFSFVPAWAYFGRINCFKFCTYFDRPDRLQAGLTKHEF